MSTGPRSTRPDAWATRRTRWRRNALIGRQLAPLLVEAGYRDVVTRTVYADQTLSALIEGFIRNTFSAMIESVRDDALAAGLTTRAGWDRGIADLRAERRCRWNLPLHLLQGFRYEAGCTQ